MLKQLKTFIFIFLSVPACRTCFAFTALSSSRNAPSSTRHFASNVKESNNNALLKEGRLVEFIASGSGGGGGANSNGKKKQDALRLGAVVGKDGKRNLKIATSSGRILSLAPRSIKYVVPNGGGSSLDVDFKGRIERHERAAAAALENDLEAGGFGVRELWELMLLEVAEGDGDAGDGVTDLVTLSELLLGDSTSLSCYATRAVLTEGVERYCFKEITKGGKSGDKSDGPIYEPRQADVVETMRSRAKVEAVESSKWDDLKQRIDDIASSSSIEGGGNGPRMDMQEETEEVQLALHSLERLACLANLPPEDAQREEKAASGRDAEAISVAKQFLQNLGRRATPETARQLLVSLGVLGWSKHSNLDLIRLNVPTTFDQRLEDAASDIASNPPPDLDEHLRLDLTHLPAFAIDDASTKEIDDALSVEIISTGDANDGDANDLPIPPRQRIWIHIADPSRYITLGSPLDKEARRRGTSIYLPTETIPMFPMSLAAGPLSLNPGKVSCALSVGITLDDSGGIDEATPPIITPSLVKTTRLTYDQVDSLLDPFCMVENDGSDSVDVCESVSDAIDMNIETAVESLRRLEYVSQQRLQWRMDGISIASISSYELPDMTVKAGPSPDAIDGWGVDVFAKKNFAANRIVTECALAANEAVALYGTDHGVPMPFRSQEMDAISDAEIDATPEGPCRSWLAIQSTRGSRISADPLPHDGMGLDAYVHATSPVRRYADLALHHQIKSHLRGDTLPFPKSDGGGGAADDLHTLIRIAQDATSLSRQLERPANDYWLKEFLRRRGRQITQALVLRGDRWKDNIYKLFLPELGAILSYRSTTPLANGQNVDIQSSRLSEFL